MEIPYYGQKETTPTLIPTNLQSLNKISEIQDNLSIFFNNIILYCKLSNDGLLPEAQDRTLRQLLRQQLNELWFDQKFIEISQSFKYQCELQQPQAFEKKLYELQQIIRAQGDQKNNASSQQKYVDYENQVNRYIQDLECILGSQNIKKAIDQYQIYQLCSKNGSKEATSSEIDIPSTHYFMQKINTNIDYAPSVFKDVKPVNHQYYISEAAKTYHKIAPFKIKHISLSISDPPIINIPNYLSGDIDPAKAIIHYCMPGTHKIAFYNIADVTTLQTVGKEYYQQRQLQNQWTFSTSTRSLITPNGKIYAVNCRTNKDKIDSYLYQITDVKASNRGPLPSPKRDSSIIFLNGSIYIIGGAGQGQKCSRKAYRYAFKQKKWHQLRDSNVALRKPTLCAVGNRFICKLGGLNEFDYINKVIEMYDSLTNRWSLVRASPRNIMQEVQILEDSQALQINDDQIYIFGGKNANKFATDTGFLLMISEIRQKRKGAARVTGQLWNVSVGKRNILTFFGEFYASNVLIHHNCIYGLRTEISQPLL